MAQWMELEEPLRTREPAPQWTAFLELGFRPLYLLGCLWAALSVALWVHAPQWIAGRMPGVFWHAHEMLWAFVATIAVGFLFTAGSNWTGRNPLQGRALGALCLLWLVARAGFLLPGPQAFAVAALCETAFFCWAALALGRAIQVARSRRNYGLPLLLAGLGAADALYLWSIWQGDYGALMQRFNAGLLCMAVIALLIARRVIPFFAMRAVSGLQIPMHTASGQWQLGAGVVAIACLLAGWWPGLAAGLAVAGVIALWQVLAWKPQAVRRVPLLWILYLGHAALGAGLLVAGAHAAGWVLRPAWPGAAIALPQHARPAPGCSGACCGCRVRSRRTSCSPSAACRLAAERDKSIRSTSRPGSVGLGSMSEGAGAWMGFFCVDVLHPTIFPTIFPT